MILLWLCITQGLVRSHPHTTFYLGSEGDNKDKNVCITLYMHVSSQILCRRQRIKFEEIIKVYSYLSCW